MLKCGINKRLEALNALADIREYIREQLTFNESAQDLELPEDIVAKFNTVAVYLGTDKDWCK